MTRSHGIHSRVPDVDWDPVVVVHRRRSGGFISYLIIKVCTRHRREIGWLTYVLAAVLLLYFVFVRGRMG